MPETIEALIVAAAFLVPGFVAQFTISLFMPVGKLDGTPYVLRCLTLSGLVYAVMSIPVYICIMREWYKTNPTYFIPLALLVLFVFPVGVGVLLSKLATRQGSWNLWGMRLLHPMPNAWDFYFSMGRPAWVTATLKDGTQIAGLYRYESFAGSNGNKRDLYLGKVCPIRANNKLGPPHEWSDGVWVSGEQIAMLEFEVCEDREA